MKPSFSSPCSRRTALATLAGSAFAAALAQAVDGAAPKKVLLRSSWQTVNIGDIAHTPGVLSLLRQYLPEVEVTLWPSSIDNGVEELLLKEFPKLKIATKGSEELKQAFQECDFLLHGSGASIVAQRDLVQWKKEIGKPYGIYGITFPRKSSASTTAYTPEALQAAVDVLSAAEFVFFRESKSLEFAKSLGAKAPVMEFGPDGAFACDLRDPEKAETFLSANGLEDGKFMCCIPRLRYSPYWEMKEGAKFDEVKHARNEEMKEHDHAQLREAVIRIVRETDLKVLVCPEDSSHMALGKAMIVDKLPEDVRGRVVWRPDYWLTGEAISVYVRSAGLFGNEMHSPIMCVGHGIPAVVCRFEEQTNKGYMWEDIGLGEWLFNLDDEAQVARIVPTVLEIVKNPEAAKAKAAEARKFVEKRQKETMEVLAGVLVLHHLPIHP